MPAPTPQPDETRQEYMDRCTGEGNTEEECQIRWDEGPAEGRRARSYANTRGDGRGMNIKELRQQRADLSNEIQEQTGILDAMLDHPASVDASGARVFSEEQEDQYEKISSARRENQGKLARVNQSIERWETNRKAEETINAIRRGRSGLEDDEPEYRAQLHPRTPKVFYNLGEQLRAIYDQSMGYSNPKGLEKLNQINAAAFGAGESIGADGGFLVQQDFAAEIFRKMHEGGEILSRVRTTPVSGNGLKMPSIKESSRATGSRWGGVQGFWVGEGVAPTATRPEFGQIEFTLKRLAALGYATEELLEDTTAMAMIFSEAFSEELRWLTENAFINGSGAGEPLGILNSNALVSVAAETGQTATTIVTENIVNMWSRMWARSRTNAVWFINQDIEPQLFTMALPVGTGGSAVYMPAGGLSQSPFGTLMGRPVIPTEYNATLGTVGDLILADLSQYMMIDKGGIQQDTSMHVRFTTAEQAFRAMYRLDGKPLWETTLTPANSSNTQSPFVALATRS